MNIAVPAGTGDAAWLRAFHAVVPGVVRAFGPDVLVTQHGTDSHREDPLADLNLSIDGQRTSYQALRDLAETVTGGRWLALGGGGYCPVRVAPRAWTHLLAIVSGRDIDPATPLPADWLAAGRGRRPRHPAACRHVRRHTTSRAVPTMGRRRGTADRSGHHGHPQRRVPAARAGPARPPRLSGPVARQPLKPAAR